MDVPKGGIAFFDSGIGGLTVLAECKKYISTQNFYYYGDNARAPYGNLPINLIKRYVFDAFDIFQDLEVSAAVIACNTVTAVCVDDLRRRYSFPIIGTEPAVQLAAKQIEGEVYVLTTRATYESERFQSLCLRMQKLYPLAQLRLYACDGLAGAIEHCLGREGGDFTSFLPKGKPSAVVLGCTHYIYIGQQIENYYACPTYDGNRGIALRLRALCGQNDHNKMQNWETKPPTDFSSETLEILTTHNPLQAKGINTNKCSWLSLPKDFENGGQTFFLGSGKMRNLTVYKHMFGF